MSRLLNLNKDEYYIDFNDPRSHALDRWGEIETAALDSLPSPRDRETAKEPRDDVWVLDDIQSRWSAKSVDPVAKIFLSKIKTLPQALRDLMLSFKKALHPLKFDQSIVWGLVFLNVQLSTASQSSEQLNRTSQWAEKLRRAIERFNRAYRMSDADNEGTLALIEIFENTLSIMVESVKFLRRGPLRRTEDESAWSGVLEKIKFHQSELDDTIKHLTDINTYTTVSLQQQARNLELRHALQPDDDDKALFPILMVPYVRNPKFFGRQEEIADIDQYLRYDKERAIRTYSTYGRRGVGKTEVALEYAYKNPSKFDAIFWISCETSLTLRNSFTNVAIALNMPGADSKRNHEENLLNVQKWLKVTPKRWLMIFDNADPDSELLLRSYWPIGANGSILITSRSHYNFMKDKGRKGATIAAFGESASWELLLSLTGDDWKAENQKPEDVEAAKSWLRRVGGLPLSINTIAGLLAKPRAPTGLTASKSYELFKRRREELPQRQLGDRTDLVHSLDALFDMTFKGLSDNARDLLSVLSLLAPDEIPIELFLPKRQSALDGKLEFAKQEAPIYVDKENSEAALTSIVNLTNKLSEALAELSENGLIRLEHRIAAVHRVIGEAMNYSSIKDLQNSFASASQLVFEAFPKQVSGNSLYDEWKVCETYITHAVYLAQRFIEYRNPKKLGELDPVPAFVGLLTNASWYLYEVGEYDLSNSVVETAKSACEYKHSHTFSLLCNTHGSNFSELNKAADARRNFRTALDVLEGRKDTASRSDLADVVTNMGNIESATGHYEEGLKYYSRAVEIYPGLGDLAAWRLGNTYMGMGRCYAALQRPNDARKLYNQAEQLFVRTKGADKHFMAHVHYAYGNLDFEEGHYPAASRSFEACLKIASSELPIHPITAAAYYSLGCTEFAMDNLERAKNYLRKARNIAELRSPTRDDGTIARILWKTAMVLLANPEGLGVPETKDAEDLLNRAFNARSALITSGEGTEIKEIDLLDSVDTDDKTRKELDEESFDLLVPIFFR